MVRYRETQVFDVPEKVEIHCTTSPEFTKRYGRKVKAAGGRYSACRGDRSKRYVTVPCAGNEALIASIVRDFGDTTGKRGRVVMISRGIADGYVACPAWMVVHYIQKKGEIFESFVQAHRKAMASAVERKISGFSQAVSHA